MHNLEKFFPLRFKVTEASPLAQKLNDLYESVRDFQDRSGRALSAPFIKLPNKTVSIQIVYQISIFRRRILLEQKQYAYLNEMMVVSITTKKRSFF